jgi:macrolide transport system ATP-binding/permease protein
MLQDIRFAVRLLLKNPGFTAIAVLSLALGIGANSVAFSLVNAFLFKPLPVEEPKRLVWMYGTLTKSSEPTAFSYPDFVDYRSQATSFSDLFAYTEMPLRLLAQDQPAVVWAAATSENFFTGIGLKARIGRVYTADDGNAPGSVPLAMIGEGLWRRQFGADASTIGKKVTVNGHDFTIIGVLPAEWSGPRALGFIPEVWIPLAMLDQVYPRNASRLMDRKDDFLFVLGRLKPGAQMATGAQSLQTIGDRLNREHRRAEDAITPHLIAANRKTNPVLEGSGIMQLGSVLTLIMVGFVLLIACANVANLMLAKTSVRSREIAIRLAIGASRSRLARQLLTETLLLSLMGGALGLMIGRWIVDATSGMAPKLDFEVVERAYTFSLDWRIVAFTTLATFLATIVSGVTPSIQGSRSDLTTALKGTISTRGPRRRPKHFRSGLVVAQIALCIVMLIGAGVSIRSAGNARNIDPGFSTENVLIMRANLELQGYDQPRRRQFYQDVRRRLEILPGVQSASIGFPLPLDAYDWSQTVVPEGFTPTAGNERGYTAGTSMVAPGYFKTMGTNLVAGREFGDFDTPSTNRVAIVNQALAEKFWPNDDAMGKRIRLGLNDGPFATVVGIAETGKYVTLGESPRPYVYLAALQDFPDQATIIVRTGVTPASLIEAVRQEIRNIDPSLSIQGIQTIDQFRERLLGVTDTLALMLAAFGAVALGLAGIGLYGVINFSVAQRAREIGIRVAVGADGAHVVRMIVRESLNVVVVGIVIGLAAGVGFARLMTNLLYGVSAADIPTLMAVSALVVGVGTLAAYIPARRAAAADPLTTLRAE